MRKKMYYVGARLFVCVHDMSEKIGTMVRDEMFASFSTSFYGGNPEGENHKRNTSIYMIIILLTKMGYAGCMCGCIWGGVCVCKCVYGCGVYVYIVLCMEGMLPNDNSPT